MCSRVGSSSSSLFNANPTLLFSRAKQSVFEALSVLNSSNHADRQVCVKCKRQGGTLRERDGVSHRGDNEAVP